MKIQLGDMYIGSIENEYIPALYFFSREMGFQVNLGDKKMQLNTSLHDKKVGILREKTLNQSPLRKPGLEEKALETIGAYISKCGAKVSHLTEFNKEIKMNLAFSLELFKMQGLKQPVMEIYHDIKGEHDRWILLLKDECKKSGIKFISYPEENLGETPWVKVQFMFSIVKEDIEEEEVSKTLSHILSIGLMCMLLDKAGSAAFSLLPFEVYAGLMNHSVNKKEVNIQPKKPVDDNKSIKENIVIDKDKEMASAEAFFDYHLLVDQMHSRNIKIIGNLNIKNTGNVHLNNPIVCIRVSPPGSIKITGQILPPHLTNTMGIQTGNGAKGWKYMNKEWFNELEEKGELWINTIENLCIPEQETVSIPNIQIKLLNNEDHRNIQVDAFVFFQEESLEIPASNKISLLLTNNGKEDKQK
ncbi:hypothetical protein [Bacillus sp. J33]|uniref:hypothetical protein n=1 Tax=Bacillus sp. J33 TaxID=935836 RepID=UPI00047EB82B|nr:hypothetical protein [Bacillus sp. J33]